MNQIRCSRGIELSMEYSGGVQVSLHNVIIIDSEDSRKARKEIRDLIEALMEAERMTYNLNKPRKELLTG